jgi:D-alanine-D-alanine ligase-like ATP-grasp enzyme
MQKRVGVLRGGTADSYDSSIAEGAHMLRHLAEKFADKYKPVDIFIDKEGIWHIGGVPTKPWDLADKVDVVWDTLGSNVSAVLDNVGIPRTGRGASSYMLENNRELLAGTLQSLGIKMPRHIILPAYQKDFDGEADKYVIKKAQEIHGKWGAPWIVRSLNKIPSMGIHVAQTYPQLIEALEDGVKHGDSILIEESISGKSIPVHSLSNFRKKDVYVFPLDKVSNADREKVYSLAEELHRHLGAKHYLYSNFVLHPRGTIYITEISFMPDLTEGSHLSQTAESIGAKLEHLVEHILENI